MGHGIWDRITHLHQLQYQLEQMWVGWLVQRTGEHQSKGRLQGQWGAAGVPVGSDSCCAHQEHGPALPWRHHLTPLTLTGQDRGLVAKTFSPFLSPYSQFCSLPRDHFSTQESFLPASCQSHFSPFSSSFLGLSLV